jgi:DNA-binding IclR family transcriptional regulator
MIIEGKRDKQNIVNNIIDALSGASCMGFSHAELAKIVGVHRDTLRVYMKPLIKSGTVWRDQPKLGNYHIS